MASNFANRLWGTFLAAAPVLVWFVYFAIALDSGITDLESQALGFGVVGIVLGLFLGQMFGRRWAKG